ncbi:LytTR family transcriptional regulator DNA-binding domain-containing protein [Carnobacterium gallinarum]|uniref:LytTR family transcriptional regulator DNA-binding domain-containing protein n=1 Tax=Carnobacterium gallinarum TaxID=2749 RepID=UPI0005522B4E|nr:LytTR family transcriptional regulator DNA-binding domain-containing protein [Carnobacterium gallinarum]
MKKLRILNVMKQDTSKVLLKNINLEVTQGEKVGIKCSADESDVLFNLIEGKTLPTSGQIETELSRILSDRKADGLYEKMTLAQYIHFFTQLAGTNADLASLKVQFSLIDGWHLPLSKLTIAQKKRVILLRMFLFKPELILIESPLTDLDNEGIELYLKCLDVYQTANCSILFTASYLEELILLSSTVYVKNAIGLEKIDLSEEKELNEDTVIEQVQPSVFKISCKVEDKIILFNPNEIDYIESIDSVSQVYVNHESFPSNLTMTELERRLGKFGFFRCHRSYLINLQRVRELISYSRNSYTLILNDEFKTKLPLSRTRLEEMKQLLEI